VGQLHMELFLEHSKTDQYREGVWTLVAWVGGPFCPVSLVERLIALGQYSGLGPLMRSVVVTNDRQYAKSKAPVYSTLLQWFKKAALLLNLDPDLYGTHSGRRGSATGATATDVPDCLFKQHGHWRSERAKDLYVVDCLSARLLVTQKLRLQPTLLQTELEAFERDACFFGRSVNRLFATFSFISPFPPPFISSFPFLPASIFCTCLHEPLALNSVRFFSLFKFNVYMSADTRSENCEFSTFAVSREPRFSDRS
jgi:hypothetical protein